MQLYSAWLKEGLSEIHCLSLFVCLVCYTLVCASVGMPEVELGYKYLEAICHS